MEIFTWSGRTPNASATLLRQSSMTCLGFAPSPAGEDGGSGAMVEAVPGNLYLAHFLAYPPATALPSSNHKFQVLFWPRVFGLDLSHSLCVRLASLTASSVGIK